ncbi:MAG: prolyl oligopeptidase family serine peptidase [Gammaproteobacteria bacterium]|nr:prolyl oligopeptidase family serine peptidase [Gammaproteobacteria bacterium]
MTNIVTQPLNYQAGDATMHGHIAYDTDAGARPGVLVVHEWWGLTDYLQRRAQMLAELGYTALAVDMYGGGQVATAPDAAGALMNGVLGDMNLATQRIQAAYDALAGSEHTDASRMACMGYCFGGAMSLHAARLGMDLRGVVSFHGSLGSTHAAEPGSIKARILVCHGAADALVPDEQIDGFKAEMTSTQANYEFIAYEGALHGFTNPDATANGDKYGLPLAYDKATDEQSWADMQRFFSEVMI